MTTTLTTEELYERYVLGNDGHAPLTLVKGSGCRVWDEEGRDYLDFISGIAVNTLGHCHPHWVERIAKQAAEIIHTSNLFRNPLQAQLAERICDYAGKGKVFFCNSGAEANEALLKLARLHGKRLSGEEAKRFKVLVADKAFHGRTFGAMAATPQAKIQNGFGPMLDGFGVGKLNDIDSFAKLIDEQTCAIFIETIQGEGGIHSSNDKFLQDLRELCDKNDLLLLIDEVQCGIGRTGDFFAFEKSGIKPDAVGMAKGLGGGMPIGAVWMQDHHASLVQPGMHGTTFGGNPIVCAAALATLDTIEAEKLIENVRHLSGSFRNELENIKNRFPSIIGEIRGRGFLVALGLNDDPKAFVNSLRQNGLLCPVAGCNAVRLLPPLNVTAAELEQALNIITRTLEDYSA